MPEIQYPYLLFAFALVLLMVVFFFIAKRRRSKAFKNLGDPELVNELLKPAKRAAFTQKFLLIVSASTLLVLALANLRIPTGDQSVEKNGIDVMIALDVSKSMLAQDLQPNRLERAKQMLNKVIDKLPNDRIGLVIFAGKAYIQMPLTGDHAAAKMYLASASPDDVPTQGTVISEALKMSNAVFNSKEKKYKSIILVTDGEDHDEEAASTAKEITKQGVVINTVGIGSTEGATLTDPTTGETKKDQEGNMVVSKLNQPLLADIAKSGNGIYQPLVNTEDVASKLHDIISTMDRRNIKDNNYTIYTSLFQWLIGLALVILLLELVLPEVRKRKVLKPALAMLLLVMSMPSFAQNDKKLVKQGNEKYKIKNYPAAAADYLEALKINPKNIEALYNLGNAYYKGGKKQEAVQAYEKAAAAFPQPINKSKAYYNKGVVLHNDNKLPECIEEYKKALRINPNDDDARQNLQKALRQQKQEQEKQQQNKEKDKSDEKQNPSKMKQQDAENKLKALLQEEKKLQDNLHKVNAQSPERPEKDW